MHRARFQLRVCEQRWPCTQGVPRTCTIHMTCTGSVETARRFKLRQSCTSATIGGAGMASRKRQAAGVHLVTRLRAAASVQPAAALGQDSTSSVQSVAVMRIWHAQCAHTLVSQAVPTDIACQEVRPDEHLAQDVLRLVILCKMSAAVAVSAECSSGGTVYIGSHCVHRWPPVHTI
jgi:hypothetical protein